MIKINKIKTTGQNYIRRYPLPSFFISLGLLLLLIILASFIGRPAPVEEETKAFTKKVEVYTVGQAPTITAQGKIEKTGTITVAAQSAGVIQKIDVTAGDSVGRGANLVTLTTSYSGGNIPYQQLSLAKAQFDFQQETQGIQSELIQKQRELAEKSAENAVELREISAEAIDATQAQLDLNQEILDGLNDNLESLESASPSAQTSSLILSTKQLKSQFLAAQAQLDAALRNTQYSTNVDNPAAQIPDINKELTLKQLELQEKSNALNLELAQINYRIAAISASLMHPVSPFAGTIEKVHIQIGELINPGTPLVTLTGTGQTAQVIVTLPPDYAQQVSKLEPASLILNDTRYLISPVHMTTVPLQDNLYHLILSLPDAAVNAVYDQEFVTVNLPLGYPDTAASIPTIPIDIVHQTQEEAFVFVVQENKASIRPVALGTILGSQVEVKSGLSAGDIIIQNRTVSQGDPVEIN